MKSVTDLGSGIKPLWPYTRVGSSKMDPGPSGVQRALYVGNLAPAATEGMLQVSDCTQPPLGNALL